MKINNVEIDEQELIAKGWTPPAKPRSRQRVEVGSYYYFIDGCGVISSDEETAHSVDSVRFSIGNYYNTQEEAEERQTRTKQLATQRVIAALEIANSEDDNWKVDWCDETQSRYCFVYSHTDSLFHSFSHSSYQYADSKLYGSTKAIESVIASHEDDLRVMCGVES